MGDSGFYTLPEAARISKVPESTVRYWAQTSLIVPTHSTGRPKLYSFADLRDLVVCRTLKAQGAGVRAIRRALEYVRRADDIQRLAHAGFGVTEAGELFYEPAATEAVRPDRKGQRFWIDMGQTYRELGAVGTDVRELHPHDRVVIDPRVRGGTPVVHGTRIPTRLLWELAQDGASTAEIVRDYPALEAADVEAAIKYESELRSPRARPAASG